MAFYAIQYEGGEVQVLGKSPRRPIFNAVYRFTDLLDEQTHSKDGQSSPVLKRKRGGRKTLHRMQYGSLQQLHTQGEAQS